MNPKEKPFKHFTCEWDPRVIGVSCICLLEKSMWVMLCLRDIVHVQSVSYKPTTYTESYKKLTYIGSKEWIGILSKQKPYPFWEILTSRKPIRTCVVQNMFVHHPLLAHGTYTAQNSNLLRIHAESCNFFSDHFYHGKKGV